MATTSLGSTLDPTFNISLKASLWRVGFSIAVTLISIFFGGWTIYTLFRRPWRPTLVFIIVLLASDWFKAVFQFTWSAYWLAHRPLGLETDNPWCQAEGFLFSWAIEMSDCTLTAMLSYVVFGVATRLHKRSFIVKALYTLGLVLWICLPPLAASLAFVHGGRYTNQGTSCYLPIRPFWYRLGLSWIPRYSMLLGSSAAVFWLFVYVKLKHRSFMLLLKPPDEESTNPNVLPSTGRTGSSRQSMPTYDDFSPISPASATFDSVDAPKPRKKVSLQPPFPATTNSRTSAQPTPHSNGTIASSMATDSVTTSADEVLRRLRRLWVYPLVYFFYWTVPFAYHAMTYKLYFVLHPIPAIAGLSSTFIGLQCTFMSIAVWLFERPTASTEAEAYGRLSVWEHFCDAWRPASVFDARQWEKTADQRQSAIFAKQRLAIEQEERRMQRAMESAVSSPAMARDPTFADLGNEKVENQDLDVMIRQDHR